MFALLSIKLYVLKNDPGVYYEHGQYVHEPHDLILVALEGVGNELEELVEAIYTLGCVGIVLGWQGLDFLA
jgi:hypothetical protein